MLCSVSLAWICLLAWTAGAQPPATSLLFAPHGAAGIGLSAAGVEDMGSALWTNPAGIVHLRYRELDAGLGSNSNGLEAHAGYFDPAKLVLGLPMAFRFDGLSSNFPSTAAGRQYQDAALAAVSAGTGFFAASRLSVGAAARAFYLKSPGGNGVGAVADLGLLYRPGEIVRFSYGLKNIGADVDLPGREGNMSLTQLFGIHVKSPSHGNIALDVVLGWPTDVQGFWSVAGTYRFSESFGMRFSLAEAKEVPILDGRGVGFFMKTGWGKFDASYHMADLGSFFRLTWTRRSARPPAVYPPLLRMPARPGRPDGHIIYGEGREAEPPRPAEIASKRPDTSVILDAASTAVAIPIDESTPPDVSKAADEFPKPKQAPQGIRQPAAVPDTKAPITSEHRFFTPKTKHSPGDAPVSVQHKSVPASSPEGAVPDDQKAPAIATPMEE